MCKSVVATNGTVSEDDVVTFIDSFFGGGGGDVIVIGNTKVVTNFGDAGDDADAVTFSVPFFGGEGVSTTFTLSF